jgi:zinc protease
VGLLRQTLLEPRFDIDAIERVRAQIIAGLKSDAKDPAEIARAAFNQEAFGLSHPYGSDLSGRISTVEALTRDHIVQAHQNALVLDRIRISAVGDIGAEDLGLLLDALLKDIPAQSAWPLPKAAELALATGVEIVPFPTPQSVALFGHLGLDRDHPDFFAAYILNHIFGGSGFESRLMQALREERGLTYGVSTYLASRNYADLLLGQFASANDRMAEAVDILREEWDEIARDGITETELQLAQTYLTGAYPLRFDGNAQIAQILVGMQQQGLQPSYLKNRNKKVMAVTLKQANRVAKELFRPELLRMFIVGEPEDL